MQREHRKKWMRQRKKSYQVFDGVLETNTGKKIGKKGETLDDATITGGIDWYYKNVEVIK